MRSVLSWNRILIPNRVAWQIETNPGIVKNSFAMDK